MLTPAGKKIRRRRLSEDFCGLARVVLFVTALTLIGFTGAHWVSALFAAAALLCLPGVWIKRFLARFGVKEWVGLILALALIVTGVIVRPPFPVRDELAPAESADLLSALPPYAGSPFTEVNGNVPFFTEADQTAKSYESYGRMDLLGRCGACVACVGVDLMPTAPRENISAVRPSGWQTIRFPFVDGESLYNRCHLLAFQLTGENANPNNLITGTRYLNTEGMLPFENRVADYVRETGYHVLYRVTPLFSGTELVARGVLMEALSVEDGGAAVRFCVFCYNVQPRVSINYATGEAWETYENAA